MSRQTRPLVSVVTPFYDSAEYLDECIRSVLDQDYPAFEYLLIDNCSTDGGDEIARSFAERSDSIRFVRYDEFLEQIPNFNRALRHISTDARYVKVVTADDLLLPGCLSRMVALAEEHPAVGVISSYRLKGTEVKNVGLPLDRKVMPGRELCRMQLLDDLFLMGSTTTVMYRAEIVRDRDPMFPEESLHSDTEACYEVLGDWDFGFVHQVLTFNRVEEHSISGQVRSYNPHLLDKLIVLKKFGPEYLSREEFDRTWKRISRRYWRYLARSLFAFREPEFWDYHRRGLATVDMSIRPAAIARALLPALGNALMRPAETTRAIRKAGSRLARRLVDARLELQSTDS